MHGGPEHGSDIRLSKLVGIAWPVGIAMDPEQHENIKRRAARQLVKAENKSRTG